MRQADGPRVPVGSRDLDSLALDYRLIYNRDWFMVAENDRDETVAMAITIPDINQVYKKMRGRLLPLGWWYYLRRKRIITRMRVGFLGVLTVGFIYEWCKGALDWE